MFLAVLAQGAQIDPLAFSQGQRLGPSRGIEAALELVLLAGPPDCDRHSSNQPRQLATRAFVSWWTRW